MLGSEVFDLVVENAVMLFAAFNQLYKSTSVSTDPLVVADLIYSYKLHVIIYIVLKHARIEAVYNPILTGTFGTTPHHTIAAGHARSPRYPIFLFCPMKECFATSGLANVPIQTRQPRPVRTHAL